MGETNFRQDPPDKLDAMRKINYEEIVLAVKEPKGNVDLFLLECVSEEFEGLERKNKTKK